MAKYTIHQAKTQFSKLLQNVAKGEEVTICNRNQEVARLVPIAKEKRRLGWATGKVNIAKDFDELLGDFKDYIK